MNILPYIFSTALSMGMDPHLVVSVVEVESNWDGNKVGPVGELGLMQIRPEYSLLSKKDLLNNKKNIKEGIKKLKEAKRYCKHQIDDTWIICYNKGITGGSRIKYPYKDSYYIKVKEAYGRYITRSY